MTEELMFLGARAAQHLKDEYPGSITVLTSRYGLMAQNMRMFVENEECTALFPGRLFVEVTLKDHEDSKGVYCDAIEFAGFNKNLAKVTFYVLNGEDNRYRLIELGTAVLNTKVQVQCHSVTMPDRYSTIYRAQILFPMNMEDRE